jgi:hypothetical protein
MPLRGTCCEQRKTRTIAKMEKGGFRHRELAATLRQELTQTLLI